MSAESRAAVFVENSHLQSSSRSILASRVPLLVQSCASFVTMGNSSNKNLGIIEAVKRNELTPDLLRGLMQSGADINERGKKVRLRDRLALVPDTLFLFRAKRRS